MRSLGLNPSAEDLQDIVAEIDVDNSGTIEFDGKSCMGPSNLLERILNKATEFYAIMSRKVKSSGKQTKVTVPFKPSMLTDETMQTRTLNFARLSESSTAMEVVPSTRTSFDR